jgi:hypothetical protein
MTASARDATLVANEPAIPGTATSLLCIGLVTGAIECFWRSARIDRDDAGGTGPVVRRWRLAGVALIVTALALVERPRRPG